MATPFWGTNPKAWDAPTIAGAQIPGVVRLASPVGRRLKIDDGQAAGKAEGEAKGQREAMADLCEVLGIELTEGRRAQLDALDLDGLNALRTHLKTHRGWP